MTGSNRERQRQQQKAVPRERVIPAGPAPHLAEFILGVDRGHELPD
jgi:hypothetical protein